MNGERMDAAGQFGSERLIDHAMALDPALSFEGLRHDIDPEMRFSPWSVTGMARMQVRFVNNPDAFGRKSLGQLSCDVLLDRHDGC